MMLQTTLIYTRSRVWLNLSLLILAELHVKLVAGCRRLTKTMAAQFRDSSRLAKLLLPCRVRHQEWQVS